MQPLRKEHKTALESLSEIDTRIINVQDNSVNLWSTFLSDADYYLSYLIADDIAWACN